MPVTGNRFTVVIPAWNESSHLEATLRAANSAIASQAYPGNIIVVDNNSDDDTAAKATALGATVVFEPVNQIARARNTGADAADCTWLVFVDADTIISDALLSATLTALASGHAIGGGAAVAMDRPLTGFARLLLSFWNWYSVKYRVAAGCYLFCDKAAFNKAGRFDEKQYAAEELYLSKKLRRLAKQRGQQFIVIAQHPVVSSARKLDWYSSAQLIRQVLFLLLPGATKSKRMLAMWYDRSRVRK